MPAWEGYGGDRAGRPARNMSNGPGCNAGDAVQPESWGRHDPAGIEADMAQPGSSSTWPLFRPGCYYAGPVEAWARRAQAKSAQVTCLLFIWYLLFCLSISWLASSIHPLSHQLWYTGVIPWHVFCCKSNCVLINFITKTIFNVFSNKIMSTIGNVQQEYSSSNNKN
jgi:hypothetical protein